MNLLATSPDWILGLLILLLLAATVQDAVQLRISNLITVAVFVLALVAAAVSGLQVSLWQNALAFAIVLAVGTLLFSRGLLGGGDVKLLAAVALWADIGSAPLLIAAILICGGIEALVILLLRAFASDRLSHRVKVLRPGAGIPYGIAICLGTLAAMVQLRQG